MYLLCDVVGSTSRTLTGSSTKQGSATLPRFSNSKVGANGGQFTRAASSPSNSTVSANCIAPERNAYGGVYVMVFQFVVVIYNCWRSRYSSREDDALRFSGSGESFAANMRFLCMHVSLRFVHDVLYHVGEISLPSQTHRIRDVSSRSFCVL